MMRLHHATARADRVHRVWWMLSMIGLWLMAGGQRLDAQESNQNTGLERRVSMILSSNCAHAGCHTGPDPQRGMGLATDRFYSNTVGRRSTQRPDLMLVSPGRSDSSYLIMKLRGSPGIVGRRMPLGAPPLSNDEIAMVARWIDSLPSVDRERIAREPSGGRDVVRPFGSWKLGDLPTTRMLDRGSFLFLITHHFAPKISDVDAFFGLDGGANILFSLSYAPLDNLYFTLARSNVGDDLEFQGKYRLAAQKFDGWPLGIALIGTANWMTEEATTTTGSRISGSAQLPISHAIVEDIGIDVVPGVLFNPAPTRDDESPLVTIGIGGQWHFYRFFSLFLEWTPIVAGYTPTTTFGYTNRFDSWVGGLDISMGGHVFQIFLANGLGTATDQYMRGGDLNVVEGEMRLGFSIFRVLDF